MSGSEFVETGLRRILRAESRRGFVLEHSGALNPSVRDEMAEHLAQFESPPFYWLPVSERESVLRVDRVAAPGRRRIDAIKSFAHALESRGSAIGNWQQSRGYSAPFFDPHTLVTIVAGWDEASTAKVLRSIAQMSDQVGVADDSIVSATANVATGWREQVWDAMAKSLTDYRCRWALELGDGPLIWAHLTGTRVLAVAHRPSRPDQWIDAERLLIDLSVTQPAVAFSTYVGDANSFIGSPKNSRDIAGKRRLPQTADRAPTYTWQATVGVQAGVGRQSDVHPIQLVRNAHAVGMSEASIRSAPGGYSLAVVEDEGFWRGDPKRVTARRQDLLRKWWPEIVAPDGERWSEHMKAVDQQ